MTLAELLGVHFRLREALVLGLLIAFSAALIILPRAIHKLRGARIVGRDRHKPGRPEIPEMGGLGVFVAFNVGAFTILALGDIHPTGQVLVLASLVTIAGATMTGALDDLISLQQRFKAFIPLAFAVPLALYVEDTTVMFPFFGAIEFGVLYPLLFVPLGIAFASNAFNMLEGFNGLGTGIGVIYAVALGVMSVVSGHLVGLALLAPLIGALIGFWIFNAYPARVFPGDTLTLMVGAVLATAAILSRLEFWVALLFLPHLVEFLLKARGQFKVQSFAERMDDEERMYYESRPYSIPHIPMRLLPGLTEPRLVQVLHVAFIAYAALVVGLFVGSR